MLTVVEMNARLREAAQADLDELPPTVDGIEVDEDICPDEEDIYTDGAGRFFYQRKLIARDDAECFAWMARNNFYPSVWIVSDHGNILPYPLDLGV